MNSDFHGRGSASQPANRFEQRELIADPDYLEHLRVCGEDSRPRTEVLDDASRSVISRNNSPDIAFDASVNPYRGCEHGCSYCYARPSHEYLGFSAGLDFETRIVAKPHAPQLLRDELSKPSWNSQLLVMSGVTDPYQPLERRLEISRGCLQVLAEFRQAVGLITKNFLVTRDLDLLSEMARFEACCVNISITSLEPELARVLEPRASAPQRRLEAVARLSEAGIPVGVMVAPVIPGLNDHELPAILQAAAGAGAAWASYIPLRLPQVVAPLFLAWLSHHFAERSAKVVRLIRELRGGRLNDGRFHHRFSGQGEVARRLQQLFELGCRRAAISNQAFQPCNSGFRVPGPRQLDLF